MQVSIDIDKFLSFRFFEWFDVSKFIIEICNKVNSLLELNQCSKNAKYFMY